MKTLPCAARGTDLWSCWPRADSVPEAFLDHARSCPSCRGELESFKAFCAAGAPPLATLLSPGRFVRLAARTRAALTQARAPAPRWAPALALAAAVLCLWSLASVRPRADLPPAEVLENMEFFEQLDLFERWEGP